MLVLTRNHMESVTIGDDIRVTVLKVRGDIRLSIEAPEDVLILRGELERHDGDGRGKRPA